MSRSRARAIRISFVGPSFLDVGALLPSGAAVLVVAGWLMALGAWLLYATPPTVSQIVAIFVVTFLIGFGGLHHSIAGAVESFAATLFDPEVGLDDVACFVPLAAVGNLLGGSLFVAALDYSHIRKIPALED